MDQHGRTFKHEAGPARPQGQITGTGVQRHARRDGGKLQGLRAMAGSPPNRVRPSDTPPRSRTGSQRSLALTLRAHTTRRSASRSQTSRIHSVEPAATASARASSARAGPVCQAATSTENGRPLALRRSVSEPSCASSGRTGWLAGGAASQSGKEFMPRIMPKCAGMVGKLQQYGGVDMGS